MLPVCLCGSVSLSMCVCVCMYFIYFFTIPAVQFNCIGCQLDRYTTLAALGKLEVLHLAICAQHIHIQD